MPWVGDARADSDGLFSILIRIILISLSQVLALIQKKTKRSALFIQPGALCKLAMVSPTDAWGEKCQAAPRQRRDSLDQFGCAPERCLGRVLGGRWNRTPLSGNGGSTGMPKVGAAGGVGVRSVPDSFFQNGGPPLPRLPKPLIQGSPVAWLRSGKVKS